MELHFLQLHIFLYNMFLEHCFITILLIFSELILWFQPGCYSILWEFNLKWNGNTIFKRVNENQSQVNFNYRIWTDFFFCPIFSMKTKLYWFFLNVAFFHFISGSKLRSEKAIVDEVLGLDTYKHIL